MRRLRIIIKGILFVVPIYILVMVIAQPLLRGIPYTEIYYGVESLNLNLTPPWLILWGISIINMILFIVKVIIDKIKKGKVSMMNLSMHAVVVVLVMLDFFWEAGFKFYVVDEGLTVAEMMQDSRFFLIYGSLIVLTLIDLRLELI